MVFQWGRWSELHGGPSGRDAGAGLEQSPRGHRLAPSGCGVERQGGAGMSLEISEGAQENWSKQETFVILAGEGVVMGRRGQCQDADMAGLVTDLRE